MNRNFSTLVVAAFALILTAYSPAFAQYYTVGGQCPGGVCRTGYSAPATVAASPCAPCASACRYSFQQTTTFAPFGGFFRILFGGCGDSCAAVRPCARFVERGAQGSACSGDACFADPVNREFVPGEQTNAVEPCEPVAKTEQPAEDVEPCDPVETCDGETCSECDAEPCDPCAAVQTTEIERRLVAAINRARERFGRRAVVGDANLFGWARYNSAIQARFCRLGHFSGHSYEIAGAGYPDAESVVNGWIGSGPHNVILFGVSWTRVGVSAYQGRDGRIYWTATFGR